ncbi:hypothetical protein KP509_09G008500 [Ceratopteris richardii]|nr:hypothetical protein KP509_09G008500 [Ceratopteris richardii]
MYGKCDNVDLCVEIFESMQARHVIAWNVLIATHVKHDHQDVAIFFFHQMQEEGVLPNRITFISVLPGAAQSASYQMVKEVHAIYSTPEFQQDATLGNALLNTYCSLGNICEALVVFDGLSTQNLVSWTTIIGAYTQQRLCREASQSFEQMHQQGLLADQVTYISILETVATSKAFLEGKKLHVRLTCTNGLGSDEVISTALLRMYGSCDSVVQAFIIFDNMPHHSLLSWTSIIALQSHLMGGRYALQSFAQMLQEGFLPDKVVLFSLLNVFCSLANVQEGKQLHSLLIGAGHRLDDTAGANLVNLYLNSSSLEETRKLFHSISDMGVASWTAMINVCLKHHQNQDALQLFNQMLQEGILPSAMALTALLRACSSLSSLYNGVRANIYIRLGLLDADENSLIASLINMYGKCGDLRAALRIFYGNLNQNISTCTALLAVYVHHGESMKALQVCQMLTDKGFMLDGSVFLQVFLACSRSGLVTEAYESFVNLLRLHPSKLGLEHFCCMVDLCSRAEHVQDAEVFMHTMPCQPSAAIWMTLLWACRQHVDIGKAELVASYIAELNQSEGGHYVVLSNIYALAGRCDDYP